MEVGEGTAVCNFRLFRALGAALTEGLDPRRYLLTDDIASKRALIRLMYKLTLDGIDVQRRTAAGKTALVAAYREPPDRLLLDPLVRMGEWPKMSSRHKCAASKSQLLLPRASSMTE